MAYLGRKISYTCHVLRSMTPTLLVSDHIGTKPLSHRRGLRRATALCKVNNPKKSCSKEWVYMKLKSFQKTMPMVKQGPRRFEAFPNRTSLTRYGLYAPTQATVILQQSCRFNGDLAVHDTVCQYRMNHTLAAVTPSRHNYDRDDVLLCKCLQLQGNQFSTGVLLKRDSRSKEYDSDDRDSRYSERRGRIDSSTQQQLTSAGWAVRLSNENGFLSWCRNSYLCTVVAIGTLIQTHHVETLHYFKHAAEVLLMIGAVNLTWGTALYILYMYSARRIMNMSRFTAILHSSYAMFHLVFWLLAISLYLGIIETEAFLEEENISCKG